MIGERVTLILKILVIKYYTIEDYIIINTDYKAYSKKLNDYEQYLVELIRFERN